MCIHCMLLSLCSSVPDSILSVADRPVPEFWNWCRYVVWNLTCRTRSRQNVYCVADWELTLARAATSIIFVATNFFSRQTRVCRYKRLFCRNKSMFVPTKVFRDKKMFVATNTLLSRQKLYLWQLPPMIENSTDTLRMSSSCCSVSDCPPTMNVH